MRQRVPELLTNWANIIGLNTSSSSVINLKITYNYFVSLKNMKLEFMTMK